MSKTEGEAASKGYVIKLATNNGQLELDCVGPQSGVIKGKGADAFVLNYCRHRLRAVPWLCESLSPSDLPRPGRAAFPRLLRKLSSKETQILVVGRPLVVRANRCGQVPAASGPPSLLVNLLSLFLLF